jgi:3-hydroxyisobutyrate dehydrogenase-like beta-hydroxyacid dehydrogenase
MPRADVIAVLHPGEMGAAVASLLTARGDVVLWVSQGRSSATHGRAAAAGLLEVESLDEVARRADLILSICPPHAAREVAASVAGFKGVYVDANAIAPATSIGIGAAIESAGGRYVDGGIIGPPPTASGTTRLYLAGTDASTVAELFADTTLEPKVLAGPIGSASAMKMAYGGWTKGSAALLLAVRALARAEGVEPALLEEWQISVPELLERSERAGKSSSAKGWRWAGEMQELAVALDDAGLPSGFGSAAAELYARPPRSWEEASRPRRRADRQ